jgi:hypothetical protein
MCKNAREANPEGNGAELDCFQNERRLYGSPNGVEGGTGKAEAAKLPDTGISPKQWPKKRSGRKRLAYRTRQQSAWGQTEHQRLRRKKGRGCAPRDSVCWKEQRGERVKRSRVWSLDMAYRDEERSSVSL